MPGDRRRFSARRGGAIWRPADDRRQGSTPKLSRSGQLCRCRKKGCVGRPPVTGAPPTSGAIPDRGGHRRRAGRRPESDLKVAAGKLVPPRGLVSRPARAIRRCREIGGVFRLARGEASGGRQTSFSSPIPIEPRYAVSLDRSRKAGFSRATLDYVGRVARLGGI